MTIQEQINKYLEIIYDTKNHDEKMVNNILKKYDMKPCIELVNSLSYYLDYINSLTIDDDEYFWSRHKKKYGITDEDEEKSDKAWAGLEAILLEDHAEEMQELQEAHEKAQTLESILDPKTWREERRKMAFIINSFKARGTVFGD